ncbi:unnamed protein product [Clavelina lepadiformis]|uniref:Protein kinase domain-containing protein n=1 Tax=Clavelina lepadiformis TaxID=159417 RepID=A0ABP0FQR6_CLALP
MNEIQQLTVESFRQIKLYRCDEIFCIVDENDGNLGEGSYGKVRLGFHQKYEHIAVKCSEMKGGRREKNLVEKKIKKEIGHLQQANHENIVRVYGWTNWPGAVAIIMEYLPAGNLKAILMDEDIVLGPLLRARFGEEIANGLAFIHNLFDNKRLLHGDIKPENILMTEDLHCKIGDFGAAQLSNYTGSTTTPRHRDLRSAQMTLLYAAPERLQNISTKLTPKYDTFSFGMTLHMILSREMPIDAGTPVQTFSDRIIEGQRPSLESIQTYIGELEVEGQDDDAAVIRFLKEEMTRCWQQDPADRPTMTEVNEHLQSQLRNRDLNVFHKLVYDASKDLCLKKPSFVQDDNLPINRFCPPGFKVHGSEIRDVGEVSDVNNFSDTLSPVDNFETTEVTIDSGISHETISSIDSTLPSRGGSSSTGSEINRSAATMVAEAQNEPHDVRWKRKCLITLLTLFIGVTSVIAMVSVDIAKPSSLPFLRKPVSCEISEWSTWSKCSQSCDIGNQQRQRYVVKEAQHGDLPCPEQDSLKQVRFCNQMDCPVDCTVSVWSSWSECSQSCGNGTQERRRHIVKENQHGGLSCPENNALTEMRICTMMDCPMDCEISEWSSWSTCSQSCGDGRQERRRHISRPLQYGEVPCPDVKKLKETSQAVNVSAGIDHVTIQTTRANYTRKTIDRN